MLFLRVKSDWTYKQGEDSHLLRPRNSLRTYTLTSCRTAYCTAHFLDISLDLGYLELQFLKILLDSSQFLYVLLFQLLQYFCCGVPEFITDLIQIAFCEHHGINLCFLSFLLLLQSTLLLQFTPFQNEGGVFPFLASAALSCFYFCFWWRLLVTFLGLALLLFCLLLGSSFLFNLILLCNVLLFFAQPA